MKVVIIGGVAGGATAATRLRRLDETAQILMLERSGYVSYANCGLPYYVGGVIEDERALTLQTPERFWKRYHIEIRVRHEAVAIDTERKTITVRALETGETYTEPYDVLLLAPGARPVCPPLPGIDGPRIFSLRTVEDTLGISTFIETERPRHALIVGGGFIGLEMAENLVRQGIETTLVERLNQVLAPLDYDMACGVQAHLREHGVRLWLEASVTGFSQEGRNVRVMLEDGEAIEADMVILAIGVAPDTALAKAAGLEMGQRGAIRVDERMRTSAPDVFAVGDAVEVRNWLSDTEVLLPLAGPANRQARIVADAIGGLQSVYGGVQGTSILKVFDLVAASTGINEKTAVALGIAWQSVVLNPASHATYYPGGGSLMMKLLYEPGTGRILGAQIWGGEGVDKRIDVLSTAIRAELDAKGLAALELAYAPPFSSAKDPVNIAGYMIEDVRAGMVRQFTWRDVHALRDEPGALLLDVRTEQEYAAGHIEGALHIPLDELREHLPPRGQDVYVYCQGGMRSYVACRMLTQKGYACYSLSGGYVFYQSVMRG